MMIIDNIAKTPQILSIIMNSYNFNISLKKEIKNMIK